MTEKPSMYAAPMESDEDDQSFRKVGNGLIGLGLSLIAISAVIAGGVFTPITELEGGSWATLTASVGGLSILAGLVFRR